MTMASNLRVCRIIPLLLFVAFFCPFVHGKVIYVDDDAVGNNDGTSWENAYTFLQDALADANSAEKPVEIRVAQGTYKPNQGFFPIIPAGMGGRTNEPYPAKYPADLGNKASFNLINNVTIKGGYAGLWESDPNIRDIELYEAILSGDLNGDDIDVSDPCDLRNEPTRHENSDRIVNATGIDATTVLDGFTIIGGFGPFGAGMGNHNGNPTLINCTFKGNIAYHDYGGGMLNGDGNPMLINCMFTGNYAKMGGGMCSIRSSPTLTGCVFTGNYAELGAGLCNMKDIPKGNSTRDSNSTLIDCTFIDNIARFRGGGIYNGGSDSNLSNCTFSLNISLGSGGGIYSRMSNLELSDCTFIENTGFSGGGIYNEDQCSLILMNCTFRKNLAEWGGGGMCNTDANDVFLTNCIFNDNSVGRGGGGMGSNHNKLVLISCIVEGNQAYGGPWPYTYPGRGAGLYIFGDTEITNCAFRNNLASEGGGIYYYRGILTIAGCTFTSNSAENYGGALYNYDNMPDFTIVDCTFGGNSAEWGGGIFNCWRSHLRMSNCVFTGNIASNGSALSCDPSFTALPGRIELTNCILWNGENTLFDPNPDGSTIAITYSDVQGGWPGEGNINADPCLANPGYWADADDPNIAVEPNDPNAVWVDGDYHLKSQAGRWDPASQSWIQDDVTSPCIDTGDPNSPIGHEPFPNGGRINMGAYGGTAEASKSTSGLHAKYGGGTGEPNDPYLIYTAEHMNTIGLHEQDWDKHFRLMADIDLGIYTAGEFNVIGEYWLEPFIGVFDGNNHTISNFTYSPTRMPFISGLFGQVGSFEFQANAVIKDLGLIDPNIDAGTGWWVGSLAGLFVGGTITNCYVQGGSVSGDQNVGGLVGGAALMFNSSVRPDELSNSADYQQPEIFNCYTTCDVSGNENVGGLVGGGNLHLKISRCYSTGSISGDKWIGGLVGRHNGNISTCYSTASVLGNEDVGGLVGRKVSGKIYGCYSTGCVSGDRCIGGLVGHNAGIIEDCYSAGYVSGTTNVGGLLGSSTRNRVYTSFWDIETSGQTTSAGGMGKTKAEMQTAGTFLDAGWDFVGETANGIEDIWWILEGRDYPRLAWELTE